MDPTATLNAPVSINEGGAAMVGFANQRDGETDTNAGFHYAFDCNGGSLDGATYANSGTANSITCAYDDNKPRLDKGGFGSYTVRAKIMDKDGGSNEYTANVAVNNVYPTGTIRINNNAATTNNPIVNLTLSATDPPPGSNVGQMRFRNENTQTWSVWEPYQTSRQWQLSSGDGPKTVFVEYKDNAGNVSQGTTSDDIQLDTTTPTDTTAPTVVKTSPTGKRVSPTAKPTVTFSEKMDEASVEAKDANGLPTTFTLRKGATVLPATVAYSETATGQYRAVLMPSSRKLRPGATYTATVTTAVTDAAGNALAGTKSWKFTVK